MSSPLRSCEEDMVVNSEGGDFDEEDDDGDLDVSDINSPAAPRETASAAAPGTVRTESPFARRESRLETGVLEAAGARG